MAPSPHVTPRAILRLHSWLSPAFPIGAYSYSHGLEWAVEAGSVHDRVSLVDWLSADLRYGAGRNEAIFFSESWRCATQEELAPLLEIIELAAALRATSELALESAQQGSAGLSTLRQVWPDPMLEWLSDELSMRGIQPAFAVVMGIRSGRQGIPLHLVLPAFLQSYAANLVTAAVRLIPLGQTDGQRAIRDLEEGMLISSEQAQSASLRELGSAAWMVDVACAKHERQYTRLFRS